MVRRAAIFLFFLVIFKYQFSVSGICTETELSGMKESIFYGESPQGYDDAILSCEIMDGKLVQFIEQLEYISACMIKLGKCFNIPF